MTELKKTISRYITALLTVFIVLNMAILLFFVMQIGWEQIVDVPATILQGLKDPSHIPGRKNVPVEPELQIKTVSGIVTDSNLKLVCSDESFAVAVAKVRPAVVSISCESIDAAPKTPGNMRFDDPSQDLATFGGIGTGMVVRSSGYILTCHHIIAKASNIFVTPFGPLAKRYPARVVAKDPSLNVALLKINPSYELPAVTTGDSAQMEIADVVLAVGSPFGLEQTVTHGIISDNERDLSIEGKIYRSMMQTDVPINRGSSGGPLVNFNGEVIAMNMAIYSPTGVYNGISFAMPINQVKPFLARTVP